jgi:tetratricopeptide (TPR) repeat protein
MIARLFSQRFIFLIAAIGLAVFFLYWPNPRMGYVLDDHYVIAQNPAIKNPSVFKFLSSGLFDSAHRSADSKLNYYRPVLSASFALDYQLWGLNPFAQRVVNLIIHLFNSLLVFALIYLLFKNPERAAIAAILFSILPVHEWSVRYIVGRGDLLMAFFSLSSLVSLLFFIENKIKRWLWASLGLFILALLSKEVALLNIALVFIVSMYATKDFKRAGRMTLFFGIVACAYYMLRLQVFPISTGAVIGLDDLFQGMIQGAAYTLRHIMPWSMMVLMPYSSWISFFWPVFCLALLFNGLARSNDRHGSVAAANLGISWIILGILGFIVTQRIMGRLGPVLSEHFLYLESVGFVLLLAMMLEHLSLPIFRRALFSGLVLYFIVLSTMSGSYWVSEEVLLRHVQRMEGQEFTVADEQLAMRFDDDAKTVMKLIDHATTSSSQSLWLRRLGDIFRKQGQYPEAIGALRQAVQLNPLNIEAVNELAVCYLEKGRTEEGFKLLGRSIAIDPQQSDAYRLSGMVLYRAGNFSSAILYLKQAWDNDPDQSESGLHLMMAYYFVNDQNAYLQTVDRLGSMDQEMMLRFAAQEFFKHGFSKETVKIIEQSMRFFKDDPAMTALADAAQGPVQSPD